jgi:hypothetical protein
MESEDRKCLRCGGQMIAGRILDQGESFLMWPRRWYQGDARMGLFGIKSDGPSYKIDTFRCEQCGTLESIAVRK